jgi:type III pantothenate kinase
MRSGKCFSYIRPQNRTYVNSIYQNTDLLSHAISVQYYNSEKRWFDMILIEIGNTAVKAVTVTETGRSNLFKVGIHQTKQLKSELSKLREDQNVVLSSVRKDVAQIVLDQRPRLNIYQITTAETGKVKLDYKTPESLGIDRVLACLGAADQSGGKGVIVVDAGTACTIDLMTKNFVFKGGVIMPGLALISKSMREFLPELPQVKPEIPGSFPGGSTAESIRWGIYGGFINAVRSFVEMYREMGNNPVLYLTGGDGKFLSGNLKGYKSLYRENLVFDGMEAFMRLNEIRFDDQP